MSDVGVTQISGAIDVPPVPSYEDEAAEALGEKLAQLYARREQNPRADIDDLIETTRRELRRGPRLRAGEFLEDGRYRLIERMGESPAVTTWKAWDREEQSLAVIKEMVGPWVAQRMRVAGFLEAARSLQSIEHAGVARIVTATQSRDGFVWLATEFYDHGRMDRFEGDAIDVLQVVVEVANALQAAHEQDLVHARINPYAIHFDADGGAKLGDFDLAGETIAQEQGSIYVAPEQVEKGQRGTPAGDVYSLAMTAIYALNGNSLPYTVVRGPERVIDRLDVFDAVKKVLIQAVDWDTEQRFGSMAAFTEALLEHGALLEALAERAWERQRYVIASEHYTALWTLKPDDSVRIKTRLGEIYLEMEAWEEAYSCLAGAVAEAEDVEPLYPLLRRYAEGTQDFKRVADTLWNEARERSPLRRSSMREELAVLTEQRLADPDGAAEIWTLVLQDHRLPDRGERALRALMRLAEQRGDWSSFVEHAQELLPFLSDDEKSSTQYAIGRALVRELGRDDEGLDWIDQAEMGGVEPLDLAAELQEIRARKGQWRRVIKLMRLQADHETKVHAASKILLRAATIARAVHLNDEAEAIYENMLERAPQHYPALRALARMRHRSGRHELAMEAYDTLARNHYTGRSEGPEASERAADHTAYAMLLVDETRFEEALEQLDAAIGLQHDNVEALRLAGPLYLDTGAVEQGSQLLETLYALFRGVNSTGARLEAALQRADAAWYRGRLAVAMRWYNTVLDTVPDDSEAWWGLAKIAIAARGGHPGGDRAPWLVNVPVRFTPQEALARLFMGLFGAEAMAEWLSLHPLGQAVAEAGATPGRLACAGVDLLARYGLIQAPLFERLREAYPDWSRRIDAVEQLFADEPADFAVERSYRWARTALDDDFASRTRTILPFHRAARGRLVVDFDADEHWQVLLSSPQPDEPPALPPAQSAPTTDADTPAVVEFLLGDRVEFTFRVAMDLASIGSKKSQTWSVKGLTKEHALLRRVGHAIYVERVGDAELAVDGVEVQGWRLMGGETVQLGSQMYDVRIRAGEIEEVIPPDDDTVGPDQDDAEVTEVRPVPDEDDETEAQEMQAAEPTVEIPPEDVAAAQAMAETLEEEDTDPTPTVDELARPVPTDEITLDRSGTLNLADLVREMDAREAADPDAEGTEEGILPPEIEVDPEATELGGTAAGWDEQDADESSGDAPSGDAPAEVGQPPVEPTADWEEDTDVSEEAVAHDSEADGADGDQAAAAPEIDPEIDDASEVDAVSAADAELAPDGSPSEDPEVEDGTGAEGASDDGSLEGGPLAYDPMFEADESSEIAVVADDWSAEAPLPADLADDEPEPPEPPTGFVDDEPESSFGFDDDEKDDTEPEDDTWSPSELAGLSEDAGVTVVGDPETAADPPRRSRLEEVIGWEEEEATLIQHSPLAGQSSSDDEALDSLGPAGQVPEPNNFPAGRTPVDDDDDFDEALDATVIGQAIPPGAIEPPKFALQGGGGWDDDSKAFIRGTGDVYEPDPEPDPEPSASMVDAFLEVMSGPSRGTQVSVSGTVTLGRDSSCDLCIPGDSMLAPLHCRLVERDGTFLILDNATDRGTVVNGTRVTEAILMGGETIMAGVTVLRFQIHG